MAANIGFHEFRVGRDSIERCRACGATKWKRGKAFPVMSPCPVMSQWTGLQVDRQLPFQRAVWDEILFPAMMQRAVA